MHTPTQVPWMQAIPLPAPQRRIQFYRMVCEFNLRPDKYLHATRSLDDWPEKFRSFAGFGDAGRRLIARYLLGLAGEQDFSDYELATPLARLALLPPAALEQLAMYAGLLLHRKWLSDVMHSRRVRGELLAKIGADALELALESAPKFYALGDTLEAWRSEPALLPSMIRARGGRLLLDFISAGDEAIARRARLKCNLAVDAEAPYLMNYAQREQLGELIFLFLIPERLSTWDWLF